MIFLIIIFAYILCHGLVALLITPLQSIFFPELTVFASLVYLPHGVRVLATWAYGWRAIPALVVGVSLSAYIFTPSEDLNILEPALLEGIVVGAVSAFAAFELMRLFGYDCYFGRLRALNWKGLIAVGALASLVNSIGQTLVYSGLIGLRQVPGALFVYAAGDLVGLILCMVALMFVFRWLRIFGRPGD